MIPVSAMSPSDLLLGKEEMGERDRLPMQSDVTRNLLLSDFAYKNLPPLLPLPLLRLMQFCRSHCRLWKARSSMVEFKVN